jgi:hypothetical protein
VITKKVKHKKWRKCYYCDRLFGPLREKTKDHIIPLSMGGVNKGINIVVCCEECNRLKGRYTLYDFINRLQWLMKHPNKATYTKDEFKTMIKNTLVLVANCYAVYGPQLFHTKYHYDAYNDYSTQTLTAKHD